MRIGGFPANKNTRLVAAWMISLFAMTFLLSVIAFVPIGKAQTSNIVPALPTLPDFSVDNPCQPWSFSTAQYTLCRFEVSHDIPSLYLRDPNAPAPGIFATFTRLKKFITKKNRTLIFAMNAGMYDRKRNPIGLYVENGVQIKSANSRDGYGNFHLKPNGIYFSRTRDDGRVKVGVMETSAFLASDIEPDFATQSGPMLVIDGNLHPKFLSEGTSRKRRNGVGVSEDGQTIWFVISDTPVNFHSFASVFRDQLKTPNALFLDGEVSKLYARNLSRTDLGRPMGPIIAVTR